MSFNLFGLSIPYYGFFILLGIVCASVLLFFLSKTTLLDFDNCILVAAYFIAFGFVGAKIIFFIVSWNDIDWKLVFSNSKYLNMVMASGFVFYGGFLGGLCAILFIKKIHKIEIMPYLQIFSPCVALVHAFGRIGCSFAGCCYGIPVSSDFCFIYNESIAAPNNVRLFPVQGVESFFLFIFAIVFTILVLKKSNIKITVLYIFMYSILRFVLEFFRGDSERGFIGVLSTSQMISLLLCASICILVVVKKRSWPSVTIPS